MAFRFNMSHHLLKAATYFAPRGEPRILNLGYQISQRHLDPEDLLIGVIGSPGSGKSLLTKGMFPGLELTNDDNGVNIRPLPLLEFDENSFFSAHTFHIDVRFEQAFTHISILADAVQRAVDAGKRVVVEHFELIYPMLKQNADLIVGIGEEVIVCRPNVFGPLPGDVADLVHASIRYRRMAHSAEDLSTLVLVQEMGFTQDDFSKHGDVKHGFVLQFDQVPVLDIDRLEKRVRERIAQGLEIAFEDDNHIRVGETLVKCTGPRIHVKNTNEIERFRLLHDVRYDRQSGLWFLTGLVGEHQFEDINNINGLKE